MIWSVDLTSQQRRVPSGKGLIPKLSGKDKERKGQNRQLFIVIAQNAYIIYHIAWLVSNYDSVPTKSLWKTLFEKSAQL